MLLIVLKNGEYLVGVSTVTEEKTTKKRREVTKSRKKYRKLMKKRTPEKKKKLHGTEARYLPKGKTKQKIRK